MTRCLPARFLVEDRYLDTQVMRRKNRHPGTLSSWRPTLEVYEIDPRVPEASIWPRRGIIGSIGSGPLRGQVVAAHAVRTWSGRPFRYELRLPVEHLLDADCGWLIYDDTSDNHIPGKEGGLIDELTRLMDVIWSIDPEANDPVWAEIDARRARWRAARRHAKRIR